MCSHVGVMREGRLVAQGTVGEVRSAGAAAVVEVTTEQSDLAADTLRVLGLTGVVTTGTGASAPPGTSRPSRSWPRWSRPAWGCAASLCRPRAWRTCSCR